MKICITAQQNNLESPVDPRFGRCQYFLFVDSESQEYEAVQNIAAAAARGAGIKATQFLTDRHVDTLITGRVGPKAAKALEETTISVVLNASGPITKVLTQYKTGELKEETGPLTSDLESGRGRRHGRYGRS